jgi:putative peptide zinc metalloprotease protein
VSATRQKPPEFGADSVVPLLRAELAVTEADYDASGAAGVIVHDPVRHRFFRLPVDAGRMLQHWHLGTVGKISEAADVAICEFEHIIAFLTMSRLTQSVSGCTPALACEFERGEKSLGESALHNYLFFRLPLFNPTRFLDAALPVARFFASKPMLYVITLLGVVGFYFALQQWDVFKSTFFDFFSLEGLALYSMTLVGLKIFHELGHGFMARHFNCKVPVMGVAFMLMAPMLYTETTDAWRLKERRKRILIDVAGVMVELAIAAVALFLWAFLPDGPWRSAAYFVAATAWIMSLVVNLSPFMRFDGYHLVADMLGMFNFGPRAFALGAWQVRQTLFATREEAPEQFEPTLRRGLVAFAFGTWIYRFSLYVGIAYTVYKMFPKAVGIPLAVVEILFFTAFPIWREMKEWKAMGMRELFSTRRSYVTLSIFAGLIMLCALPLNRCVSIPAVLLPAQETWVYPPESSRIVAIDVKSGDHVHMGQVIAELSSPDIEQKWQLATLRFSSVEAKLSRIAADQKNRAEYVVLKEERQATFDEINGLRQRLAALEIRSSMDGIVTDVTSSLRVGVWVGRDNLLLHIRNSSGAVVAGLVNERESGRLDIGAPASFVAESGMGYAVDATLMDIGTPGGEGIEFNYLSSTYGGAIAVAPGAAKGGRTMAVSGVLPVHFLAQNAVPMMAQRGTLTVKAHPISFMALAFGRIVSVFLRESGF